MNGTLKAFVKRLEEAGELVRTDYGDIASDGRASLAGGQQYPVLVDMFGSEKRVSLALGVEAVEEIPSILKEFRKLMPESCEGLAKRIRLMSELWRFSDLMPHSVRKHAPCQDSVQYIAKLDMLPTPKMGGEPHGTIEAGLFTTADPKTGALEMCPSRLRILGDDMTDLDLAGWSKVPQYVQDCTHRLPVAVCLGGDPIYSILASVPLPDGIDRYMLAGFLRGKAVELAACFTQELMVPADCDFVLEGYIQKSEGDKFHVSCITHRSDAIFPASCSNAEREFLAKAARALVSDPAELCRDWISRL